MLNYKIHACTKNDVGILVDTIRESFSDVARRFGLTPENAPRHPSNCTDEWIKADMKRGVIYFVLENENKVVGCVACEQANSDTCYLERLAVLPGQRKRGLGKAMVNHVLSQAKLHGVHYVNIGIIAEHTELKDWYKEIGFVEVEIKKFPHLPFRVIFMSYKL